jgi:hypothetical protein
VIEPVWRLLPNQIKMRIGMGKMKILKGEEDWLYECKDEESEVGSCDEWFV